MPLTDAKRRANNKYIKEHMSMMGCKVKREDVPRYHEAAREAGTTVNAVLKEALDDLLTKQDARA